MKFNRLNKLVNICFKHNSKSFSTANTLKFVNHEIRSQFEYNPYLENEKFKKAYEDTHPHAKYVVPISKMVYTGFKIGWFNFDRDTDLGTARWDCNGAYPNKIANVLYRSNRLQNSFLFNLFAKRVDNSNSIEYNLAEPQPQITTNSVFIYKDNENAKYLTNRRGLERLFAAFVLAQGLNFTGVLLYLYIGIYFGLIVSFYYCLLINFLYVLNSNYLF